MFINYPSMRRTLITAMSGYIPLRFCPLAAKACAAASEWALSCGEEESSVCERDTGTVKLGFCWVQSSRGAPLTLYSDRDSRLSLNRRLTLSGWIPPMLHSYFRIEDQPHCSWLDINLVSGSLNSGSAILLMCNKLNIFCEKAPMGLGFV